MGIIQTYGAQITFNFRYHTNHSTYLCSEDEGGSWNNCDRQEICSQTLTKVN